MKFYGKSDPKVADFIQGHNCFKSAQILSTTFHIRSVLNPVQIGIVRAISSSNRWF